jgi:hypothetical protein
MDDDRYSDNSSEKDLPQIPSDDCGMLSNEKPLAGLPLLRPVDEWIARKYPRVFPYRYALYVSVVLFFIGLLVIIICVASKSGSSRDVGEPGLDLRGAGDGTYYGKHLEYRESIENETERGFRNDM